MRALVLATLLLSLPATAGTHLDKFDARAGLVQVSGVGEVPLYDINDSAYLLVRAKVSKDREALFAVSLGGTDYRISEDLAKELKLKVKSGNKRPLNLKGEDGQFKEGGEIKTTTLPTFDLATLHIEDLQVTVDGKLPKIDGYPVEGVIGLAPFDNQLAWAALRSKGVLKVGPSSAGAELLASVGGQALPYVSVAREKVKDKVRGYKIEGTAGRQQFIVQATLGGQTVNAALSTWGSRDCTISPAIDVGAAPERLDADRQLRWLSPTLAGEQVLGTWCWQDGEYTQQLGAETRWQATLGLDTLKWYDLAIDPVSRKIGLAKVSTKESSLTETLLGEARARAEKKPEAPAGDDEKAAESGPAKPDPKPWKALHAAQMAAGSYADAVASATKLTEIDARDCSGWQLLGDAQAAGGQPAAAISSYQRSADLWHAWWDLPVNDREKLSKELGKLKTDAEKEKAEHKVQPASCFTVEGDMALAALAIGDFATVDRLYRERLDLDPDVALAAGNASLRQGRWGDAQGPYRQAIKRETLDKVDLSARQGVAVANLMAQDWTAAEPAFQGVISRGSTGLLEGQLYLDGVRAARGQEAALSVARAMAEARPDLLVAQVLWYAEAQRAGDADATAKAVSAVEAVAYTPWTPFERKPDRIATYAWYLVRKGQVDEARKIAQEGLAQKPDLALAWLVLSEAEKVAGDPAKAEEYKAKALAFGARSPAMAVIAAGR